MADPKVEAGDPQSLPVWTFDGYNIRDKEMILAELIGTFSQRQEVGPLLAAAPLVPALVAALRGMLRITGWALAEDIDLVPRDRQVLESSRALLSHPALTTLVEK